MLNFRKELSDKISAKCAYAAEKQVNNLMEAIKADIKMRAQTVENWDGTGFCPIINPLCYKYEPYSCPKYRSSSCSSIPEN